MKWLRKARRKPWARSGRGKSQCKGPEAGLRLLSWSNSLEASQAIVKGEKRDGGKLGGKVGRAVGAESQVQLWFCVVRRWFLSLSRPQNSHLCSEGLVGLSFPIWGSVIFFKVALLLPWDLEGQGLDCKNEKYRFWSEGI